MFAYRSRGSLAVSATISGLARADASGCRLVRQLFAADDASVTVQPLGTVTLVFTDIEGSTALLDELGAEAFKEALADHRQAVREAFGAHSGYEVDDAGDGLFYAFASASAAGAGVAEAMASLPDGPVRIRVGVHTGEPLLDPPKYVGPDVHKAARIMSAAHGGQVLLSGATRELLAEDVLDLGRHRLKDFSEPVSLFQLGSVRFPPLRTISNTNLPLPLSSFVGREQEVAEVVSLVREEAARLVTLAGAGGTGKTRLALEAAGERIEPDEAVAELCGRLDNLPLALELAAARVSVLTPAQILERISQRLDLFRAGRDADPRQQTLRATIAWSYDLLTTDEQAPFARMAVFRGGCTLEAAEEVVDANLDALQSLVDKSLLRHTEERFWMLETIREYAHELLEGSNEADAIRGRHADHYLALSELAYTARFERGLTWARRLEEEHDNLRAALEHLQDRDPLHYLQLAGALGWFWLTRAHFTEGSRRLEAAPTANVDGPLTARALTYLG